MGKDTTTNVAALIPLQANQNKLGISEHLHHIHLGLHGNF